MILSFKTKFSNGEPTDFVEKILSGEKIHTIREDPGCRWKAGMHIHFATGVRTKQYKQFHSAVCTKVEELEMDSGEVFVINRTSQKKIDIQLLAKNDGLTREQFNAFFFHPIPYYMRLIHWTPYRYGE